MSTETHSQFEFNPADGVIIREPDGEGYGNWVGGKVSYDEDSGRFALFYRVRRPLEAGRAGTCAVALSSDGIMFEDVWSATKGDLAANSIEEGHCVRDDTGWRLYVSYEVVGTSLWRIDVMRAHDPSGFEAQSRRTVLWPADYGLDWIKDPFVTRRGGEWWVYAAASPRTPPIHDGSSRFAGPLDATVLARSADGLYFPSVEYVFEAPVDDTWHGRRARINSVFPWAGGYVGCFDGGRTFYDNYEEKAGLALSSDGISFEQLDTGRPWLDSTRYVCAVPVGDAVHFYYEYTRSDGAHDLRVFKVERV
jgi:hypothetical protein